MKLKGRTVLLCNCEQTMALDADAIKKALDGDAAPHIHRHLCRAEIEAYAKALEAGEPLLVACTQEAPLFREVAEENGAAGELSFVNIRERAGWCAGKVKPTAKIAALLAEVTVDIKPTGIRTLTSDGTCLVYGAGQAALEVAGKLAGRLNVSLLLTDPGDLMPPATADVPIYRGRVVGAQGHLGRFEITVDGYAPMMPSSKSAPEFLMARDGATSQCSLIFDMSHETALFTGHEKRDGYVRVDPDDPAGLAKAMFEIADMVGEFEKPIYVNYQADICAHGRSGIVGCSNCLDACPAGAIAAKGDIVEIDSGVCAGCGSCSASCPTGAVSYAYPRREDLIARMQTLTSAYAKAGGKRPVLLVHDECHGSALIGAMARFGRGLPINVLPFSVFTVTQIGHEFLAAALIAGVERIVLLAPPQRPEELAALESQVALTRAFLAGLGFKQVEERLSILAEPDPDKVEAALHEQPKIAAPKPATFSAVGGKRTIARNALAKLHDAAPERPEIIALPEGAPYGSLNVRTEGCTLCLSCVSCCPADALHDNPDRPQLRFIESACVQCGLCVTTCPEHVITLEPRYDFTAAAMTPRILHEEEPFECVRCGKPFGTRSTVERVMALLAGKHAMFRSPEQQRLMQMCDDCRIITQAESSDNPFAAGERPRVRTTDDYLAAREGAPGMEDFLKDD
jgi:ferredoxin